MQGRQSAKEIFGPRDRLRRLIAKAHTDNRAHLQRLKMSIDEIARDRLGRDVETDLTQEQAGGGEESGDGGPAIGRAELERDCTDVSRRGERRT
jgi:hypothetical protein